MSTVTVGCRLPNGLILRLESGSKETRVELRGQNADMNGALCINPTMCGYTEVDEAFWNKWTELHPEFPALVNGAIFAEKTEAKAKASAKERVKEKTGLEGSKQDDGVTKA